MERKIGETFELEGTTLRVTEIKEHSCKGCYLMGKCYSEKREVTGECFDRTDNKNVVFAEVTGEEPTEQPEPQEEQKLNLLEKLKYCPRGTRFWSPMLGNVEFIRILEPKIIVKTVEGIWEINPDSTVTIDCFTSPEPMLFPSREQRDWSKVEYKPTIDTLPKTWQEFCETHEVQKGEAYIDECCNILGEGVITDTRDLSGDRNILPNEQACRQHLALMQLHQLRDCWRQGWKPEVGKTVYAIIQRLNGEYAVNNYDHISRFLQFQDRKRAEKFLDCFRDLIKLAGDLI